METRISVNQLSRTLSDILSRVHARRETFHIERNGKPVATLSPAAPVSGIRMRELLTRLGDLPLPGEGFAEDLEAVQSSQSKERFPAWRS